MLEEAQSELRKQRHRERAWSVAHLIAYLGQWRKGKAPSVKRLIQEMTGEWHGPKTAADQREEWERQLLEMGFDSHGNYRGNNGEVLSRSD